MARHIIFIPAVCLVLGACSEPVSTGGADAATPYLGKRLVSENATFIFNSDGTFGGDFRGTPIVGVWTASAREVCSTITSPANIAGERCSVPDRDGDTVVFNRRDGSQSAVYRIEG